MKVYVVVETFLGEKVPEIKGVYKEKAKAEEIKDNYRFAFMSEQYLIQVQTKKKSIEVYVVYELLKTMKIKFNNKIPTKIDKKPNNALLIKYA